MEISKTHSFSRDEAKSRIDLLLTYWKEKYGLTYAWVEDKATVNGKVKGIEFDGSLAVEDERVFADIDVGFLAEKLGGRQYVEHKVDTYLDAATNVDALSKLD